MKRNNREKTEDYSLRYFW